MNLGQLSFLASALAVVVMLQAVFISGQLPLAPVAVQDPELPETLVQEITHTATREIDQFIEDRTTQRGAEIHLRQSTRSAELQAFDVWLEAERPVDLVTVTLSYNPQTVRVVDGELEVAGVQAAWGDAPLYLDNRVDTPNGIVNLVASFGATPVMGKVRVGTIWVDLAASAAPITFEFEYLDHSLLYSFARDANTGQNVLAQPEPYEYR